ncbi:hypothetical protein TRIUR3_34521 [Triticum urartu]|uniref:Uncharacterized protein n=1 Tax=Triticum urartu TaxID=4572 RepID=M7ZTK4_TRIUA|nr:hypothetical protein TRIUR3_34521 [Triticum urartu]
MRQPLPLRAAGAASHQPPCASIPQAPRCVVVNPLFPIAASSNSFHGFGKSLISSGHPWSFRYMQNHIRAPCSQPKFC